MFALLPGEHMLKDLVQVARQVDIAVISVDNPPVNTITAAVRAGLARGLDEVAGLAGVKAVVLRCEGSTFFSGADLGEFNGPPKEAEYRALLGRFEALPVPVIAAMHGTVLGGGLEIALACHYRIAAPGTRFGLPEVTLGIIPGAGGTQRLPRLIGADKALELILGAHPVDPATGTQEIFDRFVAQAKEHYPNRVAPLTAIEAVRAFAPAVRRGPAPRGQAGQWREDDGRKPRRRACVLCGTRHANHSGPAGDRAAAPRNDGRGNRCRHDGGWHRGLLCKRCDPGDDPGYQRGIPGAGSRSR